MKKSKIIKIETESSTGTAIDISKYFKGGKIIYSDGSEEMLISETYLKELDDKYKTILEQIVINRI